MNNEKVYAMKFSKVYPLLINKVERKNRLKEELDELCSILTNYSIEEINELLNSDISYGDFFLNANLNPKRVNIKGKICGIQIEDIEEDLMREIRYLDKLADDLAKGKGVNDIIEKYQLK
ncbi:MAG: DUF2200 family protein [Erysipelotrichaceae bacterium]|nr:DUF2200 family protein [Erysipelotrichaceae bacterium]